MTALIAGGTDLPGIFKDRIVHTYPEVVINIKNDSQGLFQKSLDKQNKFWIVWYLGGMI